MRIQYSAATFQMQLLSECMCQYGEFSFDGSGKQSYTDNASPLNSLINVQFVFILKNKKIWRDASVFFSSN